jgi:VanZ family protein
MLPLRHARRWQLASLSFLILVLAAALMPVFWFLEDKAAALSWFERNDKWLHGATFLALSIWFTGLYSKSAYWRVGLGLLLFGLLIEVSQRTVSYRTADWIDVSADAAGIILGLVIGAIGIGGWCLRVEERMARNNSKNNSA